MKLLLVLFVIFVTNFESFAGLISFDCHDEIDLEVLEYAMEEGEPELEGDWISAGNLNIKNDKFLVYLNDKEVPNSSSIIDWDEQTFIVNSQLEAGNLMSPGYEYIFKSDPNIEFYGSLDVYQTGGFAGRFLVKSMNCLVSED